jgi:hypothetical protein
MGSFNAAVEIVGTIVKKKTQLFRQRLVKLNVVKPLLSEKFFVGANILNPLLVGFYSHLIAQNTNKKNSYFDGHTFR